MAIRKRYQSLGGSPLAVQVLIGGAPVSVEFTGGMKHPMLRLPVFATSDPELQQALEDYPGFGISYCLMEAIETETQQVVLPVKEFANLATAKAYLKKNYDLPVRNGHKRSDIEKMFLETGYELRLETE